MPVSSVLDHRDHAGLDPGRVRLADRRHDRRGIPPMTADVPAQRRGGGAGVGVHAVSNVHGDASQAPKTGRTATKSPGVDPNTPKPRSGAESELEMILANRIEIAGLPTPERQFRFCETRRWRADFAYPSASLLIEVDGGAYVAGRHTRGAGFEADCEKASTAAALGYRVIRVTGRMVKSGMAVELIRQALGPDGAGEG